MEINYTLKFDDDQSKTYKIVLDDETLALKNWPSTAKNKWTALDNNKCENCPLNSVEHPDCPVAAQISNLVIESAESASYQNVLVKVTTADRVYLKKTTLQDVLMSLLGLIMPTCGCPHLNYFRPLTRFHLPFSTIEETHFRAISLALWKNFVKGGEVPVKEGVEALKQQYTEIEKVNNGLLARINDMSKGDANKNAVVILNIFAQMFSMAFDSNFDAVGKYFREKT